MLAYRNLDQIQSEQRIIHFNSMAGNGKEKADMMAEYFTKFKQSHPAGFAQFDTRDEMINTVWRNHC
jgi:predicted SnoaL-like aldol condensation-catalyzing enzyme